MGTGLLAKEAASASEPAISTRSIEPVMPYSRLMPYSMIPAERPPKMTYFMAASPERRSPLWKPASE